MNASQNQEMKQTYVSKVHKMHSYTIYNEQSVVVFSPASAFTTMMEILYCVHVTADKHYRWNWCTADVILIAPGKQSTSDIR